MHRNNPIQFYFFPFVHLTLFFCFSFLSTLLFLPWLCDRRQGRWRHELLFHFISPTWCFYWLSISNIPPRRAATKSYTLHASSLSHTLWSVAFYIQSVWLWLIFIFCGCFLREFFFFFLCCDVQFAIRQGGWNGELHSKMWCMAFQRERKFITFMETHSGTEKQKINPDTIEHNTVTCMAEIIRTASLLCTCQFTQQSRDLTGHCFVPSYFFMSAKTGKSDRRV